MPKITPAVSRVLSKPFNIEDWANRMRKGGALELQWAFEELKSNRPVRQPNEPLASYNAKLEHWLELLDKVASLTNKLSPPDTQPNVTFNTLVTVEQADDMKRIALERFTKALPPRSG